MGGVRSLGSELALRKLHALLLRSCGLSAFSVLTDLFSLLRHFLGRCSIFFCSCVMCNVLWLTRLSNYIAGRRVWGVVELLSCKRVGSYGILLLVLG